MTARAMLARLARCWRAWPAPLAAEARRYSIGARAAAVPTSRLGEPLHYVWLLLPEWLSARLAPAPFAGERHFLADVQWGQYALFLFIRIHDDLVDRQVRSPWLVYVADRYLVESETAFGRHVNASFWPVFRELVRETLDGIAEANDLQRRTQPPPERLLEAYTRVSSIFKAASAAVLMRHRRTRLFPRVFRFQDQLAAASQIIDDLADLDEDLADRRRNYVAARLAGPGRRAPSGRRAFAGLIDRRILVDNALAPVLREADRRLAEAGRAIAPLRLDPAERYVARLRHGLDTLGRALHAARVRQLMRLSLG